MEAVPALSAATIAQPAATQSGPPGPWPKKRPSRVAYRHAAGQGATFLAVASFSSLRCRHSSRRTRITACAAKPAEPAAPWTLVEVPDSPGQWYYWNEETGESSWDPPSSEAPKEAASQGAWQPLATPDGQVYYYNEATGETSWTLPEAPTASPAAASAGRWRGAAGPDGQVYYYNEATNETSWTLPEGAIFVDGDEPAAEVGQASEPELPSERELPFQEAVEDELPKEALSEEEGEDEEELLEQGPAEEQELAVEEEEEAETEEAIAEQQVVGETAAFLMEEESDDEEAMLELAVAEEEDNNKDKLLEQAIGEDETVGESPAFVMEEESDDEEAMLELALSQDEDSIKGELMEEESDDEEALLELALSEEKDSDKEEVIEQATAEQQHAPKAPEEEPDVAEQASAKEEVVEVSVPIKAPRKRKAANGTNGTNGTNGFRKAKDVKDFLIVELGLDAEDAEDICIQCPTLCKASVPELEAKLRFFEEELQPGRQPWANAVQRDPQLLAANLEDLSASLVWLEEFLWNQDWAASFGRQALSEAIQNKPFLLYQGEEGLEGTIAWLDDHGLDDEAVKQIAADARAVPYPVEPFPWIELLQLGSERLEAGAQWCNQRLGWTPEQVSFHLRKEPFCLLTAATAARVANGRTRAGYPVPEPRESWLETGLLQAVDAGSE